MIKVGSRVKFLHSTGTGTVKSISGNMANVDVDGFEIPALISDIVEVPIEAENAAIVKIGPSDPKPTRRVAGGRGGLPTGQQYGKISVADDYEDDEPIDVNRMKQQYAAKISQTNVSKEPQQPKIEAAPFEDTDYAVKLAFVPVGKIKPDIADLDAYIINDSSYDLNYCVSIWRHNHVETLKYGTLEADTKELIKRFPRSSFAQIQTLHISLMPFKPVNYVPQPVEGFDIELHPLKFVRPGNYAENDFFDENSFLISLTGENSALEQSPTIELTPKKEDLKPEQPHKKSNTPQVEDLHIESIMEDWQGLAPGEVLAAQLSRFTFVLDTALNSKQHEKIVFIHGIGKGKLKYELKKTLDQRYPKFRYQDASFAEYGYGAIMVFT